MNDPYGNIRKHLKTLRLREMEKRLHEHLERAVSEKRPISEVLESLLECEATALIERRIERRIKESELPDRKLLSDSDFDFQKGVDKQQIMELATLSFADKKQGLIIARVPELARAISLRPCFL